MNTEETQEEIVYTFKNAECITSWGDATMEQREEAIRELLSKNSKTGYPHRSYADDVRPDIQVTFVQTMREEFKQSRGFSRTDYTHRQHYHVILGSDNPSTAETFTFFQPECEKKTPKDFKSRLVSLFHCLMSDYWTIESGEIKDALDLMSEYGYDDPKKARETFSALQVSYEKMKRLFTHTELTKLQEYVQGY